MVGGRASWLAVVAAVLAGCTRGDALDAALGGDPLPDAAAAARGDAARGDARPGGDGAADGGASDGAGDADADEADAPGDAPGDAVSDARADGAADAPRDAAPDTGGATLLVLAQYTDTAHGILYAGGFVYSVDYAHDLVVVLDAVKHQKVAAIPVGPGPTKLATDGTYVYVVCSMAAKPGDTYLSVIDPATNTVVESLPASQKAQGSDPSNYPETTFPWAACSLAGQIFVDFPTNAEPDILPVAAAGWQEGTFFPAGSGPGDLSAAGGLLFVALGRGLFSPTDDAVVALRPDGSLVQILETGGALHDVIEAGGKAWVARSPQGTAGEVLAIDPATLAPHPIPVGAGAYGLAAEAGRVYAMCQYARRVDVIDAVTEQLVDGIDLTLFSPPIHNPRGIAVSPSGDVYVESDGQIAVIIR